jgi:hypothetical protein
LTTTLHSRDESHKHDDEEVTYTKRSVLKQSINNRFKAVLQLDATKLDEPTKSMLQQAQKEAADAAQAAADQATADEETSKRKEAAVAVLMKAVAGNEEPLPISATPAASAAAAAAGVGAGAGGGAVAAKRRSNGDDDEELVDFMNTVPKNDGDDEDEAEEPVGECGSCGVLAAFYDPFARHFMYRLAKRRRAGNLGLDPHRSRRLQHPEMLLLR